MYSESRLYIDKKLGTLLDGTTTNNDYFYTIETFVST
jgi:hypothetical protein